MGIDVQIQAIIHDAEEGGFWAEVPAHPGCVSQGETIDEVTANIREAIEAYLSVSSDDIHSHSGHLVEITV